MRYILAVAAAGAAAMVSPLVAPAAAETPGCPGPGTTRLIVNVDGVRSSQGLVAVTLYLDDSKKFLAKKGGVYVARVPAKAGRTRLCLSVPKPGVYGLAVYHDANGNKSFDKNSVGLPAEAYGFSNNPATLFGLPRFSSVRLNVPRSNVATTVTLTYP